MSKIDFDATNPVNGYQRTLVLENTVESALRLRHLKHVPFIDTTSLEKDSKVTMASHLGLDYSQMEFLRRSPEFAGEVLRYIKNAGTLSDTKSTRKMLGVMPRERNTRNRDGSPGFTKSHIEEFGNSIIKFVTDALWNLREEPYSYVSPEYVRTIIADYLKIDDSNGVPPLPKRVTVDVLDSPEQALKKKNQTLELHIYAQEQVKKKLEQKLRDAGIEV